MLRPLHCSLGAMETCTETRAGTGSAEAMAPHVRTRLGRVTPRSNLRHRGGLTPVLLSWRALTARGPRLMGAGQSLSREPDRVVGAHIRFAFNWVWHRWLGYRPNRCPRRR